MDAERLAAAIADGEHAAGWVLEHDAAMAALLDLRDCRVENGRLRAALKIANVQGPPLCHVCGRGREEQQIIDAAIAASGATEEVMPNVSDRLPMPDVHGPERAHVARGAAHPAHAETATEHCPHCGSAVFYFEGSSDTVAFTDNPGRIERLPKLVAENDRSLLRLAEIAAHEGMAYFDGCSRSDAVEDAAARAHARWCSEMSASRGARSVERQTVPTVIDADDLPPGVTP